MDVFNKAQEHFLSSLSDNERRLYTPCSSPGHLKRELEGLRCFAHARSRKLKWLAIVNKFTQHLGPYFQVVGILVSSNPEYAALVWGSIRLILQLAGNLGTFLDKLSDFLLELANTLPKYDEILEICVSHNEPAHRRIQNNICAVFQVLLNAFHSTVRLFAKPDGSAKRTPLLVGSLIWRPFTERFGGFIEELSELRRALLEEVILSDYTASTIDRVRAEEDRKLASKDRQLSEAERVDAVAERKIAEKERQYMAMERRENSHAREQLTALLSEIREERLLLEKDRSERILAKIQEWIHPPNFLEARERATDSRLEGTATWIFSEPKYQRWLDGSLRSLPTTARSGTNFLWIHGSPGTGKTTLAASILDELELNSLIDHGETSCVYYYFFDYRSSTSNSSVSAYRSILAQMLWKRLEDKRLLDQLSFAIHNKSQGQLVSSKKILVELLLLCLDNDSILVLDGIDECTDNIALINDLQELTQTSTEIRILVLSRGNIDKLVRWVPDSSQVRFTKDRAQSDIRLFCHQQLDSLFEEHILPTVTRDERDEKADVLVRGADGMFLWARLMVNFLRSPFLTPKQRRGMISESTLPQGLEEMYERIISLIASAGNLSVSLATNVLLWTIYAVAPMSSRHLRQALIANRSLPPELATEDPKYFEDSAIMACAGLIERTSKSTSWNSSRDFISLQLVHRSAAEMLQRKIGHFPPEDANPGRNDSIILPAKWITNFQLATACLRQLLYYTPSQPLAGTLNQRISAKKLASDFCFTDYAAVNWMTHLQRGMESFQESQNSPVDVDQSSSMFTKALLAFLKEPRVLSVWLESFYTEEYYRGELLYKHPPLNILDDFVRLLDGIRHAQSQPRAYVEVLTTVQEFKLDLRRMIEAWEDVLEQSPEVIWDEMTGFVEGAFFFTPSSTKISVQQAQGPSAGDISLNCLAIVSQTSSKGDIKGVLSIWSPAFLNEESFLSKLRTHDELDLLEFCQGWIAIYEIWHLHKSDTCAASIEIPIGAHNVLLQLQGYLDRTDGRDIDLPLTISADALHLAILGTVYAILYEERTGLYFHSRRIAQLGRIPTQYLWKRKMAIGSPPSFSVQFCPRSRYICLWQWHTNGKQRLTVKEIHKGESIDIIDVGCLTFRYYPLKISNVLFHPTMALLAFYHHEPEIAADGNEKSQLWGPRDATIRGIRIWPFQKYPQQTSFPTQPSIVGMKNMQFSTCGNYIICEDCMTENPLFDVSSYKGTTVRVSIPSDLVNDPESQIRGSAERQIPLYLPVSSTTLNVEERGGGRAVTIHRSSLVDNYGDLATVAVSGASNGVFLHHSSAAEPSKTKLSAIPNIPGIEETKQGVIFPRYEGDSLKISIDWSPRTSYNLLGRSLGEVPPAVIERDPKFISLPESVTTFMRNMKATPLYLSNSKRELSLANDENDWSGSLRRQADSGGLSPREVTSLTGGSSNPRVSRSPEDSSAKQATKEPSIETEAYDFLEIPLRRIK
ncbi:hypothetical protein GGS26DRAFT_92905 [Hypomontagnella submonticulosa]|nr:hypothetical protein GGS26DRAFT_92905 [Hypomontagnella submonticulosa]